MKALIITGLQEDFYTGTIKVPNMEEIFAPLIKVRRAFDHVYVIRNWHPLDYCGFFSSEPYCVQGTSGANLLTAAMLSHNELEVGDIIDIGMDSSREHFSAFEDIDCNPTPLFEKLKLFDTIYVAGVPLELNVFYTLLSWPKKSYLITDCTRSLNPKNYGPTLTALNKLGVKMIASGEIS